MQNKQMATVAILHCHNVIASSRHHPVTPHYYAVTFDLCISAQWFTAWRLDCLMFVESEGDDR